MTTQPNDDGRVAASGGNAIVVKRRVSGETICSGETVAAAIKSHLAHLRDADLRDAYLQGADLRGADLRDAYLRDAYLRGADLRGADLRGADLRGADLRYADLQGADLRGAYLRGAYLRDADLRGAYLRDAYLRDAKLAWNSHDIIAEILRRGAGDDTEKLKVAGLVLVCREKCWKDFLSIRDPLSAWAVEALREWIVEGDEHPAELDIQRP